MPAWQQHKCSYTVEEKEVAWSSMCFTGAEMSSGGRRPCLLGLVLVQIVQVALVPFLLKANEWCLVLARKYRMIHPLDSTIVHSCYCVFKALWGGTGLRRPYSFYECLWYTYSDFYENLAIFLFRDH